MSQVTEHREAIRKKTFEVGGITLISRMLGLVREVLLIRFLGLEVFADAFRTAFMIPNSLRKIFAEGALSAAFVPTFVTIYKQEGKLQANALTTLSFVVFETALLFICAFVMIKAHSTVLFVVPGYSEAQVAATVPMLRILMPFIFFISTSALLSGALHSVQHFFVPSFGPVLLNVVFIASLLVSIKFSFTAHFLSWMILAGGALQCIMHIVTYFRLGFSYALWNSETIHYFGQILAKFLPCFFSMSVMEVNLFVDQRFASFLAVGTVTLVQLANRFMGIPLGVFASAFSTILLPYFTRVKLDNPEQLNFYLFEATKLVFWVTIPATFILISLSDQVFLTLFASTTNKFPLHRVVEAGNILVGFVLGLCFFSLNKVLFSLYYSLHDTFYPTIISIVGTLANVVFNYYLVRVYGSVGLAVGTSVAVLFQTILSIYFLCKVHELEFDILDLCSFLGRYTGQVLLTLVPFYFLYPKLYQLATVLPGAYFFTKSFGFWFWVGPLILLIYSLLYGLRKQFDVNLYFLD